MAIRTQLHRHPSICHSNYQSTVNLGLVCSGIFGQRQPRFNIWATFTFEADVLRVDGSLVVVDHMLDKVAVAPSSGNSQQSVDDVMHYHELDSTTQVRQHDNTDVLLRYQPNHRPRRSIVHHKFPSSIVSDYPTETRSMYD